MKKYFQLIVWLWWAYVSLYGNEKQKEEVGCVGCALCFVLVSLIIGGMFIWLKYKGLI